LVVAARVVAVVAASACGLDVVVTALHLVQRPGNSDAPLVVSPLVLYHSLIGFWACMVSVGIARVLSRPHLETILRSRSALGGGTRYGVSESLLIVAALLGFAIAELLLLC
jgi:hypothetical protein